MDVTHLFGHRSHPESQRAIVPGYVSTAQPAPTGFGDPVYVIAPDYSIDRPIGPCRWGAFHGSSLPQQGAAALVCITDGAPPVVVWWEGPQGASGGGGGSPTGAAGGVLNGTYPNPGFAQAMATQAGLDAESATRAAADTANIPKALVDAKGDLLVGTANDTVSRLGAGPDGQVLTADASQPGGLKWAAAAGGGADGVGLLFSDTFATDQLASYYTSGQNAAPYWVVSGGTIKQATTSGLQATWASRSELQRSNYITQAKFIAGTLGGSVRRVWLTFREWGDHGDRLFAGLEYQLATNATSLVIGGQVNSPTGGASKGTPNLAPGTTYWLRASVVGDAIRVEIFSSDPEANTPPSAVTSAQTSIGVTAGGDARFGATRRGAPGFYIAADSADASRWQIDEFKVWTP